MTTGRINQVPIVQPESGRVRLAGQMPGLLQTILLPRRNRPDASRTHLLSEVAHRRLRRGVLSARHATRGYRQESSLESVV
jgi:hypothetical protein